MQGPPGGWGPPPGGYPPPHHGQGYGPPPQQQAYAPQGYGPAPYGYAPAPMQPVGFTCPFCRVQGVPQERKKISTGGWVVFAVLLIFCFPLFWIGLLMKDTFRVCSSCGSNLGGVG